MAISMVFAVLIIANSVMQQIEENGDTMNRLVGLMLGLLVPACGPQVAHATPEQSL